MGAVKKPNYTTGMGRYGPSWTRSLRRAQAAGAVIVVEETGEPVAYDKPGNSNSILRPWLDAEGGRHDSRDCVPVF